ncbi:hypothetical protein I302_108432 [Kwoniella bestiolae CBS 10118]|uniref:Uncharacterized protein n=1 Tax=Kwoniella bestiolae CBS 10118 TaxID=1296100 RepID=A0A1B9FVP7_9TREE|nr:hypothetical protein I302_07194 [Kwoniella bestiolae CBS 10118]OCF22849.1 hypothetical protein I302_07194 [Kwoniella bestiolae CBS 10118]
MTDPSLDFLLDGGLIPSLPSDGRVAHHELMGMGIRRPTPGPAPAPLPPNHITRPTVKSPPDPQPVYGLPYIPNNLPPRVTLNPDPNQSQSIQNGITRSTSDGTKPPAHIPAGSGVILSRGHGKNHSISNIQRSHLPASHKAQGDDDGVSVRRSLSFNQVHTRTQNHIPPSLIPGAAGNTKLHHSISDSAVHANTHTRSISRSHSGVGSSSGIRLGDEGDEEVIMNLLDILDSLILKERALDIDSDVAVRDRRDRRLDPLNLLIPLSVILEALVNERTILKSSSEEGVVSKLPTLSEGISLTLPSGEVDWNILHWYITSFGQLLNGISPFLSALQYAATSGAVSEEERGMLDDLMRSVKVYVSKMKKVFGEIAGLYVDRYSFVRGWWDEGGMKDSAGEVGRWGEMFGL